jgi:hypothetical protein
MTTNATISELNQALKVINAKYAGNISFNRIEQKTAGRVIFTLQAKSGQPGARYSFSGRRLPKASWHVHGEFFDALFSIRPTIFVRSLGKKIDVNNGNWEDKEIGSMMQPKKFSQTSIL